MQHITKTKSWTAAMTAKAAAKSAPEKDKRKAQFEYTSLLRAAAAEAGLIPERVDRRKP